MTACDIALRADSGCANGSRRESRLNWRSGPGPDALLAQSIQLNPRFAASHALLGKRRLASGDFQAAIGELELALTLRPDYSPAALHLAQAYQKAGRPSDAANAFKRVREIKEKEQTPPAGLIFHRGK